jgi:hypothetical protein
MTPEEMSSGDTEPKPESQDVPAGAEEAVDDLDDRYTLLEAFGLRLEVSNPRLADLLTMDAKDALTSDVRDLVDAGSVREVREEAEEAVPDTLLSPPSPRDEVEALDREAMRTHAALLGEQLGFLTRADGVWESPTGVHILTRAIPKPVSYAAASHYVEELKERRETLCGHDCSVLFVAAEQQAADVFKVAIRQGEQFDMMRTVSIGNLEAISALYTSGELDHSQAIVLLAPIANIDVGELLAVIRAGDEEDAEAAGSLLGAGDEPGLRADESVSDPGAAEGADEGVSE